MLYRFDGDNLNSYAYFLSHCHSDHMQGLDYGFHELLNERKNVFLYTSPISAEILKVLQPKVSSKVKPLVLEVPSLIPIKQKYITVTLLRAGHCPGSVMFLFEFEGKIILYTGDYRIHKNDFKKFNAFKYPSGELKRINKIYLDTTFFLKCYPSFPSRRKCVKEVCDIISRWIKQSSKHVVQLNTSAYYGYEDLLIEISKEIGHPIHVKYNAHEFYRCIPQMDKVVTLFNDSTPLHNNCGGYKAICRVHHFESTIKIINFSAMTWTEDSLLENEIGVVDKDTGTRVCYSTHASLEEGMALIRTLKPEAVEPCVVPDNPDSYEEMMELIENVMKEYKSVRTENFIETEIKQFVIKGEGMSKEDTETSTKQFCNLLASPPRNKRKKAQTANEAEVA